MPLSIIDHLKLRLATTLLVIFVSLGFDCAQAIEVTAERSEKGAIIRVDGELFAEYLANYKHQPAIWPIIGPTGEPVTRSFPFGPPLDTEKKDHPHHHSLWFSHENVNGHNFWLEPRKGLPLSRANVIKHADFVRIDSNGNQATLVTRNTWFAGTGNVVCEDERTWIFGANGDSRWIDCTIKIMATNGSVTFGDIKDGTFSIRVAGTIKVDSGGVLVNSGGQKNADAWGGPAEWIDNYGSVAGETVGVAMFSHPANFQHPCRWHARSYGLLCANPFGERQFPKSDVKQSGCTIEAGESLTLRYRVYLHRGNTEQARVAEVYRKFAETPPVDQSLPVLFTDDFENGKDHWATTDIGQPESVWQIQSTGDGQVNSFMRVTGTSSYEPPHRSPHSIALLKDTVVGDFELTAKVQNTNVTAGPHRDLCFFWGYQDPAHFYYVHLGAKPDPHSSQIFIVNGADRKMITDNLSPGIPWAAGWHDVMVKRHCQSGLMQVYFDDMRVPVLTAKDKTFVWGRVGLGTFDDHGNFDDVQLRGVAIQPIPTNAKLP